MAFFLNPMIGFSSIFSVVSSLWIFGGFEIGEVFFSYFIFKGLLLFDHGVLDIEFLLIKVVLHIMILLIILNSHLIVSTLERFTNINLFFFFAFFLVNFIFFVYNFLECLLFDVIFYSPVPKMLDEVIDAAENGIVGHQVENDSDSKGRISNKEANGMGGNAQR